MQIRFVLSTVAAATLLATPSASAAPRHAVRGSVPRWATSQRDRGAADGRQDVTVRVYLPLRDADGAAAVARAVSTPGSPSYGRHLTPAQFRARFAPSRARVDAVKAFLRDAGLQVDEVPANNTSVAATGTLATAARAFDVRVHRYAYRGRELKAPTSELTVPDSLGDVVAVTGLDDAGLIRPLKGAAAKPVPPPDAFVNAPPCSTYYGEKLATSLPPAFGAPAPYAPCGYVAGQLLGAYGLSSSVAGGIDGTGQTVAIVDAYAAPTILADANQYATQHGQQAFTTGQFRQVLPRRFRYGYNAGDLCGEQGWYGEETLDVEAVHSIAPKANIVYVAGASCYDSDLLTALNTIVDGGLAQIVSNSWGDTGESMTRQTRRAYDAVFTQASAEGIGMYFSTGDDGDESANTTDGQPVADFPATHPLVTAVGGTSLAVGSTNQRLFETGWATGSSTLSADGTSWEPAPPGDFLYGGGGGVSSVFAQPAYQQGVAPAGNRAIPDVAMVGDPQTGMLVGETQTFPDGTARYSEYRIGGTSLSAPLFAGTMALADQAAGHPHGFANPALYAARNAGAFTDIAPDGQQRAVVRVNYNNSVDATDGTTTLLRSLDDEAQSLHLAAGWDDLTGLGAPNGAAFLAALGG